MQSQLLRAWKLGLTTSHKSQVLSPNYDMDTYMATLFGGEAKDFMLRVGSSQKLDPTLNPSPMNSFAYNNQDPTLMIINHILVIT